ncbi:carbohydrate-binding protein [Streptosporangium sp. NPDC020072]|uniref:carbohydrate-binding protein n=1 Tax=unclassified Streptosporangium TaxID=2632669 RepID=UPI00342EBF5B
MNLRRPHAVVLAAALAAGVLAVVPPAAADVPGGPTVAQADNSFTSIVWRTYFPYEVGEIVAYHGATYRCLQAHTSLPEWEPDTTPPLWQQM